MPVRIKYGWKRFLLGAFLVLSFLLYFKLTLFAINAPTINKVQDIPVEPDTIMYSNSPEVKISGNAESGTEIRLFKNETQIATGATGTDGIWEILLGAQNEGTATCYAIAFDGIFVSQKSTYVPVTVDYSEPTLNIYYGNAGCMSNSKYQCNFALIYASVSDSGAGIDFSSAVYNVDYAMMPTEGDPDLFIPADSDWINVPGTVSNDGVSQVNFYPANWGSLRQPFIKVRLTASISDNAGNSISNIRYFYVAYNLRPPAPEITHVWDAGHNIFTGDGETSANVPDAGGWVKYFPNMTVINNPIKVRGRVQKWNLYNEGWYAAYIGDETNTRRRLWVINQDTGVFEVDYSGYPHPFGSTALDIRAGDTGDCLGRNPAKVKIITQQGTPWPAVNWSPNGEPKIIGSRLWPTFTGRVAKMPFRQTVQIGWGDYSYTYWKPQYSQVILPEGQNKIDTSGVYDDGDVFYDANNNGAWDTGEPFLDMPSNLSDGQSFSLPNFRNIEYNHNNLSCLGILSRNDLGKSSARRVVRAHNNDTYPPLLNDVILSPAHSSPYRKNSIAPEGISVKCQTWGGNYSGAWSWSSYYFINGSKSKVSLENAQGTNYSFPSTSWVHLGKLVFQTDIDVSAITFPEGTYNIKIELEDNLTNYTSDQSRWFKIDNTPPTASEMVPADGVFSNTFTSFNARIFDPALSDGSAGSGANIDISKPQIWPFKIVSLPAKVNFSNRTEWTFTLADNETFPIDHRGNQLSVGSQVELWVTTGGVYESQTYSGTISAVNGDGTIKVQNSEKFIRNSSYVVMFAIPFFTSNNGIDRVGAVPVSAITADGTYVAKVITRDRADNIGAFFNTSSPLEVPVDEISFNFDKPFLFAGIYPEDVGTFTTSPVTTRKLNPVQDGQPLSLVLKPSEIAEILPADSNGIPGDGHQVLFGQNGASSGIGQAVFGVRAKTDSSGSLSVFGVIGLASGTSDSIAINLIDEFILSPQVTRIDITPDNPSPAIRVTTGNLGHDIRKVPDLTVATCITDFGNLTPDMLTLPGIQVETLNGSASVMVSSTVKGTANVSVFCGGKSSTTQVSFFDKYPPPAPQNFDMDPVYCNFGGTTLFWDESIDIGGAGTLDYGIEISKNGSPFYAIATTSALSYSISGLTDGEYQFRARARDSDGNLGEFSDISQTLIVDTVAPPAVNCSDFGPGNNDPDEHFSVDPDIYFYFSPTDDRSGVADIEVQVSISPDTGGLVYDAWSGPDIPFLFTGGENGKEYFARIRVKDRAGNVGLWGGWSNGIYVNITGAVTPPNAPTINRVSGKTAIPGEPVPVNITSGIVVEGLSEASNLIEVFIEDAYQYSVLANENGEFAFTLDLPTGLHAIKVRAQNGFAGSGFSNPAEILVDIQKPVMTRRIYDINDYTRGERYLGTTKSDHRLNTIDFYLSDTGGSGFDISSAKITLTDIEDDGTIVVPEASYTNPINGNIEVIAADRIRFVPTVTWANCLQNGHRYRLEYEVSDRAGNSRNYNFDFVIDNNYPHEAAGVPAPVANENPNLKALYVYDLEKYPWPSLPVVEDLVPFIWVEGSHAYMIDPDFVNAGLVDWGTEPHSLLFNTIGFYGSLFAATPSQPPAQKGLDTQSCSFNLAWGYGSNITSGPDSLGNNNTFRFGFRTLVNGQSSFSLVDQDWAINRTTKKVIFHINSPNPAPGPPSGIEFRNAADFSIIYPIWAPFTLLFGPTGIIHNTEVIITDNSNAMLVTVHVPVELFEQTVEIIDKSQNVLASSIVAPGNDTALFNLNIAAASGFLEFQVRTLANGYYSTNLPRNLSYYWYYWIKGDSTQPHFLEVFPGETNFNDLAGVDARPFPSRFSVKAQDTADGITISFLEVSQTEAVIEDSSGNTLSGVGSLDYFTTESVYGFRYDLSSAPEAEGTYYFKLFLPDGARPKRNERSQKYPFRLDKTPPVPLSVSPADGEVTNSLPSFNATIQDPLLADSTEGSGPNMDPSRRQIFPFKNLGQAVAANPGSLTIPIYGIDVIATDHVDNQLAAGTQIWYSKYNSTGKFDFPVTSGIITSNSDDVLTANVESGPSLISGNTYAILYEISSFPSNDGIDKIAAVPVQPAIKGGSYLIFLKLVDKALNQGSFSSNTSIYEAAYGLFDLYPGETSLYVGLVPPHTSYYTSSAILTTEGNPIKEHTEVNLLTDKGSFTPADSNGIPGDGHQVKADSLGKIDFGLQATGLLTGPVKVRAVLGLASGLDQSVSFIQIPQFSLNWSDLTLEITPLNPTPATTCNTSYLGNAGNPVPDGSCITLYSDLGTFAQADVYSEVPGIQVSVAGATGNFSLSSANAGIASITVEIGGRMVNQHITFIDKYPPNSPGIPSLDNVLNNNGVFNLFWTEPSDPGNSGISEYGIEYSFNGGNYTFLASSTSNMYLTSGHPQGTYKFRVRAVDGAGNCGGFGGESVSAEVDTTPPVGSIIINNGDTSAANPAVILGLSASDAHGVADMRFSNDGLNWGGWIPYKISALWTLSEGDGNKLVFVRFRDQVGNIGEFSDDILLDTTGPMGGINIDPSPFSSVVDLSVKPYANDGSQVPSMWISYDGQPSFEMVYDTLLLWTVSSGFATHTVDVKYIDGLGNESAIYSASTCVDTIVPLTPAVTDDGEYSPWLDQLHASWTSSDDESGISHFLVKVGTAAGMNDIVPETNVGNVNEIAFNGLALDISGATQYYFSVIAVDKAGNVSAAGTSDGIKGGDPTPPDPVVVTDDGDFTADNNALHAAWTASNDPDSGIKGYEFSAGTSAGETDIVLWTDIGLSLEHTVTGLALSNGENCFINIKVWNYGGTSTVSISDGITIDIQPPPVPVMNAEPGFSPGNTNTVSSVPVVDALSGQVQYLFQRATDTGFTKNIAESGWIQGSCWSFSGLGHATTYYFRVKSRDAVANESVFSTYVFSVQDSYPPTAVAYSDNVYNNNDPDHIWSRDVFVSFIADSLTDDLSGIKNVYIQISDNSVFTNILHESWLGNIDGYYAFTAPETDGISIVARAKFEDVAGNTSDWYETDGITLDLSDPVAGPVTDDIPENDDNDHTVSADSSIYFAFTHSDAISGVSDVRIMIAEDEVFAQVVFDQWLGSSPEIYHYDQGQDGKSYWAKIMVKDTAGRISAWGNPSNGIRVDLSPPQDPNGEMFFINKKNNEYIGETTTATTSVFITLTIDDPSGVEACLISNDGTNWTTWLHPPLAPASISWSLKDEAGERTVFMQFIDGVGHISSVFDQKIEYYPAFKIHEGNRDEGTYPVDTYDEYLGQNKYGTDKSETDLPITGKSLMLEKP